MGRMRLQRFMAQAGVASRRKAEQLILDGQVRVNGRVVTELGTQVDPHTDEVRVGARTLAAEAKAYVLLNKPRGYVTTLSDPEKRPTVMELLSGVDARVYPVGRLDFNTEGVLLFTNDGDLANRLMHPSGGVKKTYRVKLRGSASEDEIGQLRRGVTLDDGARTQPAEVALVAVSTGGNNTWLEITIAEGRNRQIHRMAEAVGLKVAKLERIRYAGLEVGELRPGRWRTLEKPEVAALYRAAGLGGKVPQPWNSARSRTSTSSSRSSRPSSRPSPRGSSRSKGRPRSSSR